MSHTRRVTDCNGGPDQKITVNRTKVSDLTEILVAVFLARGDRVTRTVATRRALLTEIEKQGGTVAPAVAGDGGTPPPSSEKSGIPGP